MFFLLHPVQREMLSVYEMKLSSPRMMTDTVDLGSVDISDCH